MSKTVLDVPCDLGDKVYVAVYYKPQKGQPPVFSHFIEMIVTGVHIEDKTVFPWYTSRKWEGNYLIARCKWAPTGSKHLRFDSIGKTVFFNKEEGEKVLKGMTIEEGKQ